MVICWERVVLLAIGFVLVLSNTSCFLNIVYVLWAGCGIRFRFPIIAFLSTAYGGKNGLLNVEL